MKSAVCALGLVLLTLAAAIPACGPRPMGIAVAPSGRIYIVYDKELEMFGLLACDERVEGKLSCQRFQVEIGGPYQFKRGQDPREANEEAERRPDITSVPTSLLSELQDGRLMPLFNDDDIVQAATKMQGWIGKRVQARYRKGGESLVGTLVKFEIPVTIHVRVSDDVTKVAKLTDLAWVRLMEGR